MEVLSLSSSISDHARTSNKRFTITSSSLKHDFSQFSINFNSPKIGLLVNYDQLDSSFSAQVPVNGIRSVYISQVLQSGPDKSVINQSFCAGV